MTTLELLDLKSLFKGVISVRSFNMGRNLSIAFILVEPKMLVEILGLPYEKI